MNSTHNNLRPVHTTLVSNAHPIRIQSMRIGCASKSVHISNQTSELNRYMMGRVHIVSRASTLTFHRCGIDNIVRTYYIIYGCDIETMALRVFFVNNFSFDDVLQKHAAPRYLDVTTPTYPSHDFRIFALNNNAIRFECGSNPPLEVD